MKRRPLPTVREEVSRRAFNQNDWSIYALVAVIGALSYANSLHGEFVHDDIPAIVANGDVTGANAFWNVFRNDFWGTPMSDALSHKSYRPLTTLTFRLNYYMCGLSTYGWHLVNVLLHASCSALVARVGAAVAQLQRPFAALAGLLFAVHPVHTEAVSGIVGRADVLACLFFLTSLLLYHGSAAGKPRVWSSVVVAALGMMMKEIAVTALLFNALFDLYMSCPCFNKSSWRYNSVTGRVVRVLLGLLLLVSGRLAMLQGTMPAFSPQDNPPAFHHSFHVRLMTFSYLSAFNWWLLMYPMDLSHDWQMGSVALVTSPYDARNVMTLAAVLIILAIIWRCIMDFDVQRHIPVVAGSLLLVIPYLPASNIFLTVGFVIAERVLYIPSVGSVLLTAAGMQLIWRRRCSIAVHRFFFFWMCLTVVAAVTRTQVRNADWRTRETLLRADLKVLPHNAKLHYNFANFLKDVGQQGDAIKHYKEALRLWPSYASAHNNLGTLVVGLGRAEYHFLQALKYNRDHVNAHYNLGKLYRRKERLEEAQRMLKRCIMLQPRFTQAYLELLHLTAEPAKRELINTLLQMEPDNWEHYVLYGNWLKSKGLKLASLQYYLEAMRLAFRRWASDRLSRGSLLSLRASCLLLRSMGQTARILQLLTRWQVVRSGCGPGGAKLLRSWQLRSELSGRALLYDKHHHHTITSTCLHHSKLEIEQTQLSIRLAQIFQSKSGAMSDADECQKLSKKSISSSSHNKSEIGQRACTKGEHKLTKIKENDRIKSYISDYLIKTY